MTTTTDARALTPAEQARLIPTSSAVTNVVVRVAGIVAARLDLTHVGTPEQMVGITAGTVLCYLRSAYTARAIADGWAAAAVQARTLTAAVVGQRPVLVGPSSVAVMARLAGTPKVTHCLLPGRAATDKHPAVAPVLVLTVGPLSWHLCDQTAYTSLLRAWRQAARLLGDNLTEDED